MNAIVRMPARKEAPRSPVHILSARQAQLFPVSDHPAVTHGVREGLWENVLLAPVNDILSRPSKAIRARLVEAGFNLVRAMGHVPEAALSLVEILHSGSLIVDDIEDNSKVRRGKKAVHKVHGIPLSLNAGNWMYFAALEQISALSLTPDGELAVYREATKTLSDCHRGQALDLGLRLGDVTRREVPQVVAETSLLKTGALMAFSMSLGARVAGGTVAQIEAAARLGRELGLALQQLDDLGNLSAKSEPSKRYEDLREGKLTWPWAWAAESLGVLEFGQLELVGRALRQPEGSARINPKALAKRLSEVAGEHRHRFIANRLRHLAMDLAPVFPDGQGLGQLLEQIKRLEESYV